jgi:ribosomal protein S12 methylthiotransferase
MGPDARVRNTGGEPPGKTFHLVSLGCARNLVDSERVLGALSSAGWVHTPDPSSARAILVNTCGFIQSAIDESIDTILELADYKKNGMCVCLAVLGCLPQRFGADIAGALPEVDVFLGTGALDKALEALEGRLAAPACVLPAPETMPLESSGAPRLRTTLYYSFLKIMEGCRARCAYCIIPKLRGPARSRALSDILAEARALAASGALEINLVAQDTTAWGMDLLPAQNLALLLDTLAREVPGVRFRFLYAYPAHVTMDLLETVAAHPCAICPYFDIPVQHASARVLKRMGRPGSARDLEALFENIRHVVPGAVLRTTLLTGYPGETEEDFNGLAAFLRKIRFDHAGVFVYSDREDLPSHRLRGHVPEDVALERRNRLMEIQAEVSREMNAARTGTDTPALVLGRTERKDYPLWGRTTGQAPDVDGICLLKGGAAPGQWVRARVTGHGDYDVFAEVLCRL